MSPKPRKSQRHLPPCVYLKHGAYWHVKKGKWTRIGTDLREALNTYATLYGAKTGGMAELIGKVLAHVSPGLKPNTRKQYRKAANRLSEIFAEFAPDQVTQKDVAALKVAYSDRPNMGNRLLSILREVFRVALEWQLVESNPCIGIARHTERKRDRLITMAEYHAIRAVAPERLQIVMDMLVLTGQRPMDVVSLHRSDIREDGIYFKQRKTDAKLLVEWTPELRAAVERAKALQGTVQGMTLFRGRKGGSPAYKTVYDQWVSACKAAGVVDADLRDLRALSATEAEDQGHNPTALLGHTSEQMTRRYLRGKKTKVVQGPSIRQSVDK